MCNLTACGAHPSIPAIRVSSAQRRRFLAGLAVLLIHEWWGLNDQINNRLVLVE